MAHIINPNLVFNVNKIGEDVTEKEWSEACRLPDGVTISPLASGKYAVITPPFGIVVAVCTLDEVPDLIKAIVTSSPRFVPMLQRDQQAWFEQFGTVPESARRAAEVSAISEDFELDLSDL